MDGINVILPLWLSLLKDDSPHVVTLLIHRFSTDRDETRSVP